MIPLVDLKTQYHGIQSEINAAIADVLENSAFILGKHVSAFEEEFADFCSTKYAVGVSSGTSALHLALLAAGVGPGDEVITVPYTFIAPVAAIGYTGARPVFVDIDPVSYTLDPAKLEGAITARTKAIIPVHLFGQAADMDPIMEIARRHKLIVIEDAAQAHGARYKGRRVGSIGDMACFSFYPGKNLGAYGEGGAVLTADPNYNKTLRMQRDWGTERRYHHVVKGYNYRMEGLQGAVLRVKLRKLDEWNSGRRANALAYGALLSAEVGKPAVKPFNEHVFNVYAIHSSGRDLIQQSLQACGVQTAIHYPIAIHRQEAWAELNYKTGDFPIAERIATEELSLPIYPELTSTQIELIASTIRECLVAR